MTENERDRLSTIESKVDKLISAWEDPDFGVRAVLKDHEARLRSNERWKLSLPIGAVLALATIVGGLIAKGG